MHSLSSTLSITELWNKQAKVHKPQKFPNFCFLTKQKKDTDFMLCVSITSRQVV